MNVTLLSNYTKLNSILAHHVLLYPPDLPHQQHHDQQPETEVDCGSGHDVGIDVLHLHLLGCGLPQGYVDTLPDPAQFSTLMTIWLELVHLHVPEEHDGDQEVVDEEGQDQTEEDNNLGIHVYSYFIKLVKYKKIMFFSGRSLTTNFHRFCYTQGKIYKMVPHNKW